MPSRSSSNRPSPARMTAADGRRTGTLASQPQRVPSLLARRRCPSPTTYGVPRRAPLHQSSSLAPVSRPWLRRDGALRTGAPLTATWDHDTAGAFVEALFAKHHGEIYAYLVRMLRDSELAADLTQDAFVKAYKAYASLEKDEN